MVALGHFGLILLARHISSMAAEQAYLGSHTQCGRESPHLTIGPPKHFRNILILSNLSPDFARPWRQLQGDSRLLDSRIVWRNLAQSLLSDEP